MAKNLKQDFVARLAEMKSAQQMANCFYALVERELQANRDCERHGETNRANSIATIIPQLNLIEAMAIWRFGLYQWNSVKRNQELIRRMPQQTINMIRATSELSAA